MHLGLGGLSLAGITRLGLCHFFSSTGTLGSNVMVNGMAESSVVPRALSPGVEGNGSQGDQDMRKYLW